MKRIETIKLKEEPLAEAQRTRREEKRKGNPLRAREEFLKICPQFVLIRVSLCDS